ncbi:MAG: Bcr/CflA family drug resistance efflux transporter, partial [Massilia sp.]
MVLGSAWGGKRAHKAPPGRLLRIGYATMAVASVLNVGYNALFAASVPWAVLPLAVFTFGLAVAMPGIQLSAMGLFPANRGLAASMVGFIQMMSFALVSGLVAPLLFGSALKLAGGAAICCLLSFLMWRLSLRFARPVA